MGEADIDTARLDLAGGKLLGGLLVGGASRRMGRPKALAEAGGMALAERVAAALRPHVDGLVLLGEGPVPASLADLPRIADATSPPHFTDSHAAPLAESLAGPLAGILAALRGHPGATWILCPCDLPRIEPAAVAWLLGQRRAERSAVLPRVAVRPGEPAGPPQPLFALYPPAALALVESLVAAGRRAPRHLALLPGVATPTVPPHLAHCWSDADTPEDLARLDAP